MCIPKAKGGLGFKDLKKFILALLAKQGWKIITQPHSLFVRVMKEKYFPKGEFMSVGLCSYPSYTWCSIWDIRYTVVSDLINRDTTTWKQDSIRSLFGEEQLKNILSIPLVCSRPQDELIWRGDNTGVYTVKSGYKWVIIMGILYYIMKFHLLSLQSYGVLWYQVICILMWRIANEFIPTLHNLRIRKLVVNTLCPLCQANEETVSHLFRDCTFMQQVLRGMGATNTTCNREPNWKKWLETEFDSQNTEACKIRSIVYWAIWYNRNKIYHEGTREQVNEIVAFINAYYAEIAFMREFLKNANGVNDSVWKPPDDNIIKINFDASLNQHTRRSNIPDLVMAEARACLQAITMAEEMGFQDICVEGDALTIICKVNSLEENKSNISNMIKEIKGRTPKFRRLSFKYVPREANKTAHGIVIEGRRYENSQYWMEKVPHAVERLVNRDKGSGDDDG
ncbi:hypothetical protein ES332_A08G286100v1 [Gossypium tomentosum]|uniref:RNase H type-1 domain-containing protein n=1 Tax=Gossypium tomentosum TaxID=34277 RepID=A0A5D2PPR1_GOSTO|nr:hypothetical protein ES332_A08G286100v1 [Gossypium tomentosum]